MSQQVHEVIEQIEERAHDMTVSPRVAASRGRGFLLVALLALGAFLSLLIAVRRNPRMERDVVVTLRMQRIRHPALGRMLHIISWPGFRPQSLILPGVATCSVWLMGFRRDARYMAVAWLASMLSFTTKLLIQRPRPGGDGILVTAAKLRDSSFPSGHVLHYVCFWGFFAYLCFTKIRGRLSRWVPTTGIASFISLVGPSRIYLGHHWLTDVLASYSLGTAFLASMIGLHRRHDTGANSKKR